MERLLKTVIEHEFFLFIFSKNLSKTLLILRRFECDMIINVYWSSCEVPIILVIFRWIMNFIDTYSKNS